MSSSSDRAQADPIVALVCVAVLTVALAGYAATYGRVLPESDRDHAGPALDRLASALTDSGVVHPNRLDAVVSARDGHVNVTLATRNATWNAGPTPPGDADSANRPVAVVRGNGTVAFGTLRVVVW